MPKQPLGNGYFRKTASQVLLMGMMLYGLEYCPGPFSSAAPAVSPPSHLLSPNLVNEVPKWEKQKTSMLCKHCSASLAYYQHCFSHKSKNPAPHQLLEGESGLYQPDPVQGACFTPVSAGCCYSCGHSTTYPPALGPDALSQAWPQLRIKGFFTQREH